MVERPDPTVHKEEQCKETEAGGAVRAVCPGATKCAGLGTLCTVVYRTAEDPPPEAPDDDRRRVTGIQVSPGDAVVGRSRGVREVPGHPALAIQLIGTPCGMLRRARSRSAKQRGCLRA